MCDYNYDLIVHMQKDMSICGKNIHLILSYIWDQKVYFWNIPLGADIYWYKINPMACMLGVNTNVSVI